jgi:hypothetical protein
VAETAKDVAIIVAIEAIPSCHDGIDHRAQRRPMIGFREIWRKWRSRSQLFTP